MQMYNFEQVHSFQSCIITAIICRRDIIIGLIATLIAFIFTLYCKKKTHLYDLKNVHVDQMQYTWLFVKIIVFRDFCTQWPFIYSCQYV